jgi:phosphoribosyl-AMP cyclohydrolase
MSTQWIDALKFDEHGLIPAIVQDARTKEVLMVAYMNREAVKKTLKTKRTHFYSRSRTKLWLKGESSGHIQKVQKISLDCDGDAVLVLAAQVGGACHTGYKSCFFRAFTNGAWKERGRKLFDPDKVYGKSGG